MNTIEKLSKFISMQSISGNPKGNQDAINFLTERLKNVGFSAAIEGEYKTDQPTIIAYRDGINSSNKIVIYGHYDVAEVMDSNAWISKDPFNLECIDNRYFCRGIADNKGPLHTRLSAIESMYNSEASCPAILYLIQGEEEVMKKERVAIDIFQRHIMDFNAKVYLDETGFNDIEVGQQIIFLWSKAKSKIQLSRFQKRLAASQTFTNPYRFENRHLNKLTGSDTCPLLENLPEQAIYIGFGPNDKSHRIHRDNESLNKDKLRLHQIQFSNFLTWLGGAKSHED